MILVLLSLSFFDQCVNLAWMAGCCFSQAVTFFPNINIRFIGGAGIKVVINAKCISSDRKSGRTGEPDFICIDFFKV